MDFRCEDLPQFGVALIPPAAPGYDAYYSDILRRLDQPTPGAPPGPRPLIPDEYRPLSPILVNRAAVGIALIQQVWTAELAGAARGTRSIGNGINPSVLLPFGIADSQLRRHAYWHVVLPGSKRLLLPTGQMLGDNSDVRPPAPDEMWVGGIISGGTRSGYSQAAADRITVSLDGVFFADGSFAGPDRRGIWEQTIYSAEAYLETANLARRLHGDGVPADRIVAEVQAALGGPSMGPPPRPGWSPDQYRQWTRGIVAQRIAGTAKNLGDDRAVFVMMDWLDARVPAFRKL